MYREPLLLIAQELTAAYRERAGWLAEVRALEAALAARKVELLAGVDPKTLGANAEARELAGAAILMQDPDYDEMQALLGARRNDLTLAEATIAGLERQFEAHKTAVRELQIKALWPGLVADDRLSEQAEEAVGTYAAEVVDDNEDLAMPF